MQTPQLMSIGVFARATRLSIRALRNYDRLGLLVPAEIDPDTGYRRYAVEQFSRAGLIRRLRELELPLAEIAGVLAADNAEQARAAIQRHRRQILDRAARLDLIAAQLDAVLDEPDDVRGRLHVYERRRGTQLIASTLIHAPLSGLDQAMGPAFEQLLAGLAEQGIAPAGPAGSRYLGDDPDAAELTIELFVPVDRTPHPTESITVGRLPDCVLAAVIHEGGFGDVDRAYRSLGRWIAEHDRRLVGPAEERYLVPPSPGQPVGAQRTEIAWPVAPGPDEHHHESGQRDDH